MISSGANVPFDDSEIFLGPTGFYADGHVAAIPDFVANCGMARAFAYFMGENGPLTDEGIFEDVRNMIRRGMKDIYAKNPNSTGWWQTGLQIALDKLNQKQPA